MRRRLDAQIHVAVQGEVVVANCEAVQGREELAEVFCPEGVDGIVGGAWETVDGECGWDGGVRWEELDALGVVEEVFIVVGSIDVLLGARELLFLMTSAGQAVEGVSRVPRVVCVDGGCGGEGRSIEPENRLQIRLRLDLW